MEETTWVFPRRTCGKGTFGEVVFGVDVRTTSTGELSICTPLAVKRTWLEGGIVDPALASCIRETLVSRAISRHSEMHNLIPSTGSTQGSFRPMNSSSSSNSSDWEWCNSMPPGACSLGAFLRGVLRPHRRGMRGADAGFLMHSCLQSLRQFDDLFPDLGHFDIKTDNLVLARNSDGRAMLTDFGHVRALGLRTIRTICTIYNRPPEICLEDLTPESSLGFCTAHRRVDIWSLGMVFAEILQLWCAYDLCPIKGEETLDGVAQWAGVSCRITGFDSLRAAWPAGAAWVREHCPEFEPALRGLRPLDIHARIRERMPFADADTLNALADLLLGMLRVDPFERYTLDQVVAHPFWALAPTERLTPETLRLIQEFSGPLPDRRIDRICPLMRSPSMEGSSGPTVDPRTIFRRMLCSTRSRNTLGFATAFLALQLLENPERCSAIELASALQIASALLHNSFVAENPTFAAAIPSARNFFVQIERDCRRIDPTAALAKLYVYHSTCTSVPDLFRGLGISDFVIHDRVLARVQSDRFPLVDLH